MGRGLSCGGGEVGKRAVSGLRVKQLSREVSAIDRKCKMHLAASHCITFGPQTKLSPKISLSINSHVAAKC